MDVHYSHGILKWVVSVESSICVLKLVCVLFDELMVECSHSYPNTVFCNLFLHFLLSIVFEQSKFNVGPMEKFGESGGGDGE